MSSRRGKKWIDPKKSTKFRLIFRSYDDPRYGDSESTVRILAPVENPNVARKRLPDEHYKQKEKLIELVESYNDAQLAAEDADEEQIAASQQRGRRPEQAHEEYDEDEEDEGEYSDDGRYDDEEEDYEEGDTADATRDAGPNYDDDRFADADEDDDDLPPLEEDDRKKPTKPAASPATKTRPTKDVKGKGKQTEKNDLKEYELGEYGFDDDYDYSKHFKPMGSTGAVFMEAPTKKGAGKENKVGFMLREDEDKLKSAKVLTTDIVDFLDDPEDIDPSGELPEDVLAALEDPEAFETLNDDFVVLAEDEDEDEAEEPNPQKSKAAAKRQQHRRRGHQEEDEEEEDYEAYLDEGNEDEDLDALLQGLKANPEGDKRRPRNEMEQVFDARFEKALAEFEDDEIGELDEAAEDIKGDIDVDQLRPVLKEFLVSRRRKKGVIMNIAEDDDNKVSHKDHSSKKSQAGDIPPPTQGHESEEDAEQADGASSDDEAFEYVVVEEPRDQWDCESITTTYTNTENHPTLIDDEPIRRRKPPIVLSKKTGIPLGVLPSAPAKGKKEEHQDEEAVNQGQARPKNETKEERKARKQQIKEARKANRERKKELKGVFKQEELRQLSMQAKGQGKRVIRLK